ncbi:zinc-dependent alcohol dehydrogenase [Chelativorans sp. M5D2P16]|uniref:zinc-dependent alcohol dehydrogenase n=1 Tax=Chelativorans sp. M5D2P16 TaxID=3095678 RepID=UPI002ACA3FD3|nr:alcohol dehydrogenase catalytic domain-containing protein [Chelativorans sp. M5D2P16]MDZ5697915.1 alcohol dehydrogenase catalytic domain-containing protein [Chelativorans sp. M5D2P16]
MKAVRLYAARDLRVEAIERPGSPGADEVRLKVRAAGICGSDLHNFSTGQWISRAPSVAGHEFAAIVTEVGAAVTGFAPGDTVVADSRYWCGKCPACRSGRQNICESLGFVGELCDGGFAEETLLPARLLIKHDPALDPAIAAMAEPLAVALHAVRKQAVPAGEAVLVAGCGPIGGLAALLLARFHTGPLLVADKNAARVALVADVTGARTIDLDDIATAGGDPPLRYALDATGNIGVMEKLLKALAGGGSLALVGIAHGAMELDPNLLVERETALIGCHAFTHELPEAVALLSDLQPALARFIGERIPLEEVPAAYARLLAGDSRGLKTILQIGESGHV